MAEDRHGIHGKPEPSRALVPVQDDARVGRGGARPLATFLAQIMACEARVPEFRQHRRVQPEDASARYESACGGWRIRRLERIL